jgi:predicted protein tyrosine phosphatase
MGHSKLANLRHGDFSNKVLDSACGVGFRYPGINGCSGLPILVRSPTAEGDTSEPMYLEALERQFSVCSLDGAVRLTNFDKHYWNVISICGPRDRKAVLPWAKSIYHACFDDVEDAVTEHYRAPRAEDIADIFGFVQQLDAQSPGAPLMIHCQQGIARSAAIAASLIYRSLPEAADRYARTVDLILKLRPQAKPNRLVLTLSLARFLPLPEAREAAEQILSDARILRNKFRPVQL